MNLNIIEKKIYQKKIIDVYCHKGSIIKSIKGLIKIYPQHSFKRKILLLINILNILILKIPCSLDLNFRKKYEFSINNNKSSIVLISYHKIFNQRAYIYFFDNKIKLESIIKIGLDKIQIRKMEHEFKILKNLIKNNINFKIPKILNYINKNDIGLLHLEAIGDEYKIMSKEDPLPEEVFYSISNFNKNPKFLPLKSLRINKNLYKNIVSKLFKDLLNEISDRSMIRISSCHCDLGSDNVFRKDFPKSIRDYAIIDWEHYSEDAPYLSDKISYFLGRYHAKIKSGDKQKIKISTFELFRTFGSDKEQMTTVLITLLYLASKNLDLAKIILFSNYDNTR